MCYLWIIWWWSKSNVFKAKCIQIRRKNKEKKICQKSHRSINWLKKQANKQTNKSILETKWRRWWRQRHLNYKIKSENSEWIIKYFSFPLALSLHLLCKFLNVFFLEETNKTKMCEWNIFQSFVFEYHEMFNII